MNAHNWCTMQQTTNLTLPLTYLIVALQQYDGMHQQTCAEA